MEYNYSKLKGLIVEKCGNYGVFAKAMGITPSTVSALLTNKKSWTQDLIVKSVEVLDIVDADIVKYFYCGMCDDK